MVYKGQYNSSAEKHGMKNTKLYQNWKGIKSRCFSSNKESVIKYYRSKGIGMCKQWSSFMQFYRDMGDKPDAEYSIDRIDNNKGYCPHNCRWATKKEQSLNRDCVMIRKKIKESKYPGVNKQTKSNSYYSAISVDGKKIYLGSFKTEEEAFMAFCNKYKEIHGVKHEMDFF